MIAISLLACLISWELSFTRSHAWQFWSGLSGFQFGMASLQVYNLWS